MGVIRKLGNVAPVITFSEESINSLGISQPSTPPSEPESLPDVPVVVHRRDPNLLLQRLHNHRKNQHTGARKTRRANNAQLLQTLVEDVGEVVGGEPTITDFKPKTESAFTKLLNNTDNMRVWQYFITRDDQEQQQYLETISPQRERGGDRGDRRVPGGFSFTQVTRNAAAQDVQIIETDGFAVVPPMSDCHSVHPAFNEEQRFGMMEPQMQSLLKKKHLPLGMLWYLEEEVVDVFSSDTSAVYITQELTSYERLLVHAICQYNFLTSKSTTIAGARRTKVENIRDCFHTPDISLTVYIETYFTNK